MSSQIKTLLVKDNILNVTDQLSFAVEKGGQNVSVQRFPATSTSASSHTYQIQVPSHSTVVSRELLWHSKVIITLQGTPGTGMHLVNMGLLAPLNNTDCIAPFPLHQAVQNMNCQINNTSVSMNTNQVLDPLLRCMDRKQLSRWNSTTPVYLDNGSYLALQNANSPFKGYDSAFVADYPPRGAFVVDVSGNTAGSNPPTLRTVTIEFEVSEPLMLSPFVYGDACHTSAGIYGVSQINWTMQLDSQARRVFRFLENVPGAYTNKVLTGIQYQDSYIECRFLTPHPSTLLPELNVVPYATFNNYVKTNGVLPPNTLTTYTSDTIQLNSIPDKVFIYVKEAKQNQNNGSPDQYTAIKNVNVSFNNQVGILSSASEYELFRMSQEAGNNSSWLEWSGRARASSQPDSAGADYATVGSVLVLDFAEHINISEDYYAPSSIGTFNFQIQVQCESVEAQLTNAELNVVFMNSGCMATQNGSSNLYTGVLTKQMVLDASLTEGVSRQELNRFVGGGLLDTVKSIGKFILPIARTVLPLIPHPGAQAMDMGLKSVGLGKTGGAMSGGMQTGGRRMNKYLM